jgi:hypothetical protein
MAFLILAGHALGNRDWEMLADLQPKVYRGLCTTQRHWAVVEFARIPRAEGILANPTTLKFNRAQDSASCPNPADLLGGSFGFLLAPLFHVAHRHSNLKHDVVVRVLFDEVRPRGAFTGSSKKPNEQVVVEFARIPRSLAKSRTIRRTSRRDSGRGAVPSPGLAKNRTNKW